MSRSSVYSDDSRSSAWTTTYTRIPKKQPKALRFLSWVAGAPPGATAVKKRTRDYRDDRSVSSGGSTFSNWDQSDTQLSWVVHPNSYYYSGSSRGSTSSGHSKRSGRSHKSGGGSRKHFDGAVPRPVVQPMNMNGVPPPQHPPPPPMAPPMDGGYDGGPGYDAGYGDGIYDEGYDPNFGGGPPPAPMMGGYGGPPPPHMPPPPPMHPQMPGGMPGGAPFIDLTGQNHPGGRGGPSSESDGWSSEED
ncbi:hypothetical protein IWW34DRAFT_358944 [Fusarium oxysporum f. sp. albedinis]|jgi:hypothetical protein|nr:hypothetical protein FOMA001_g7027 [Fusarium oxysporum f. sp. matthiolae]KAI3582196.1 hypothetical protein IWW34DRAFT_358944 [Fusarium oxysporum f. sp. albedinis]KAJ0140281.1 Uncharacterized protein HZ326_16812 [Fusarium oxysporum f. sp. albedinis]KAK2484815.1 hypothetical protein H9L39_02795 [Fusarium oxysporum f. sp. albedinis]